MKCLIVGGGIAGLTVSAFLEKAGIETEISEIVEEWKPVGAGIVLWPNCLNILEMIGLKEATIKCGNRIDEMKIIDLRGKKISTVSFDKIFDNEMYALAIKRAELHQVLVSGLKNTKVTLNETVIEIKQNEKIAEVKFSTGRTANYDFVIGADGINSKVRNLLFGEKKLRYAGYTTWRFMVNGDAEFDQRRTFVIWGKGKRLGIVPVNSGKEYYCFAVFNARQGSDKYRNISHEQFLNNLDEFRPAAGKIIDLIKKDTILINNDICDIKLKKWYSGRVALMGDAAHAITPNMGAGASMAMEDSLVISEYLCKFNDPETAFRKYYETRHKRVNRVCDNSYRLGKIAQLNNGILRSARNFAFRLIPESFNDNEIKKITREN